MPSSVRISTRSSSGSSSRTSARRSSSRLRATSRRRLPGRSCRTLARSAGRRVSMIASRLSTPCSRPPRATGPSASDQSTVSAWPRRRNPRWARATCSLVIRQSRLRSRSRPASTTVSGSSVSPQRDPPVEQLADDQRLAGPLLEPAHVQTRVDDHLAGVDRRDPGHRQEDPAARRHLHDQAEHAGRLAVMAQHHHEVAHLAHLVARRVEHADPGQVRHEDARAAASRHSAEATAGVRRRRVSHARSPPHPVGGARPVAAQPSASPAVGVVGAGR